MPSSPTERDLLRIAVLYDEARIQLEAGEIDATGTAVAEAEALLQGLAVETEDGAAERDARGRARQALDALVEAATAERDRTGRLIQRSRRGKKALSGYAPRLDRTGVRIAQDL